MDNILDFILKYYPYLIIPFISGFVGWFTNVIALKMTFYPLEYIGIRPFGWQGIIPSKAAKMAKISVSLMTSKLVSVTEVFSKLSPERIEEEIQPAIRSLAKQITNEVMQAQAPLLWNNLPEKTKKNVIKIIEAELPRVIKELMDDIKVNIEDILDLKSLAIAALMEDKALINHVFLSVGNKEFKFIEHSGFYFGFLFGIIQAVVFYLYDPWWVLVLFGIFVGFATNFLAIRLIFRPLNPVNILGLFKVQGIFLKRQDVVAREYARIIKKQILTIERLFDYTLRGPDPDRFSDLSKYHTDKLIDTVIAKSTPLVGLLNLDKKLVYIKNIVHYRFIEELPIAMRFVYPYANQAIDVENILSTKMAALSKAEFEAFLRPVFQEDEMKLMIVGAFLGGIAAAIQFLLFFW
ncbi:MAG: hypothetical protein DRJ10_20630 [Bacteroidetes bacterium]|nr:MAG: hypothetical protein DRJ10_20630 [Bacteroidota bacterium]